MPKIQVQFGGKTVRNRTVDCPDGGAVTDLQERISKALVEVGRAAAKAPPELRGGPKIRYTISAASVDPDFFWVLFNTHDVSATDGERIVDQAIEAAIKG
jgi:hypothetical protein